MQLSDLADTCEHPRNFMIAKASFEAAVEGKLSAWEKETLEGAMESKADQFLNDIESVRLDADVVALNVDAVAAAATSAADALKSFREGLTSWRLPVDIDEKRKCFHDLCSKYDKCMGDLEAYADTVAGFTLQRTEKAKGKEEKLKGVVKSVRDTLYMAFTKCGVPKLLAKVA